MDTTRKTSYIPLTCAVGALTAWSLKGVAIGAAGGLDRSPWESPLFLLGLALALTAALSTGVALSAGRHRAVRVAAGLLAVVVPLAASGLVGRAVRAVAGSDHWVYSEMELWFVAVALVCVGWYAGRRSVSAPRRGVLVEDLS